MSTRAPSLGRGEGRSEAGLAFFFAAKPPPLCLPHRGRGTAPAVDRVLPYIARLRRSPPLFFIPLVPYPARSARHLPQWGRLWCGNTAIPIQPPPLRGTSFQRKEGVTARAPSLGRGCRAQRGGVGFLFAAEPPPLCLPHWGRGTAPAVDRVLSQTTRLGRSFPLSFIPLVPYPARSARHLPLEGKALCQGYRFPHPTSAPSGHLLP